MLNDLTTFNYLDDNKGAVPVNTDRNTLKLIGDFDNNSNNVYTDKNDKDVNKYKYMDDLKKDGLEKFGVVNWLEYDVENENYENVLEYINKWNVDDLPLNNTNTIRSFLKEKCPKYGNDVKTVLKISNYIARKKKSE